MLVARGTDLAGTPVAPVAATFLSANPTAVTLNGATAVARGNGVAVVTASYAGLSATTDVKVRQVAGRIASGHRRRGPGVRRARLGDRRAGG